jgi:hypothetical protein
MSNTLIILIVLGVINFLIKKFASKPVDPAGNENERPAARPIQSSTRDSQQILAEISARKFNAQARALGLIDEKGNLVSSNLQVAVGAQPTAISAVQRSAHASSQPSSQPSAQPSSQSSSQPSAHPKPLKVVRVSQKPIGVTDFAPKDSILKRSRTVQAAVTAVVAGADSAVSPIISKSAMRQSPTRPISAIDALIASRLSQRISSDSHGQTAQPKRIWNAKSMRQGMVMAEILSPPVALRA